MRTVVINNRESLVIGQLPHVSPGNAAQARDVQLGETVTLTPGVNLVDTKKLVELRKNPQFELLFRTKIGESRAPEANAERFGKPILVIDKTIGKDGEVPDQAPLAKLTEQQCEALISETLVTTLLQEWLVEETRGTVRRALQRQIDTVTTGSPAAAAGR